MQEFIVLATRDPRAADNLARCLEMAGMPSLTLPADDGEWYICTQGEKHLVRAMAFLVGGVA